MRENRSSLESASLTFVLAVHLPRLRGIAGAWLQKREDRTRGRRGCEGTGAATDHGNGRTRTVLRRGGHLKWVVLSCVMDATLITISTNAVAKKQEVCKWTLIDRCKRSCHHA